MKKAVQKLMNAQIQEQMNQAVECINANQYAPARAAFLECASLCELIDNSPEDPPAPTQPVLDIP